MLPGPLNKNVASSSNYYNSFAFPYTTTTTQQQAPIALINFRLLIPLLPFPLLLLALLVVLPGIREQRYISLLAIGSQLCVGTLLIGSITLPFWKLSETEILVHLQPFSKQRHLLNIGVNVGLSALNISLDYVKPFDGRLPHPRSLAGLHLNEQFDLTGVSSMKTELRNAYREGQPFPILCVLEYFSLGQDAFSWGNQFRKAGYYTKALLWFTFGCWLFQFVLLPLLPHYFAKTGLLIGFLILLSNMLYVLLSPNDLHIAFPSPNGGSNFTQFRCSLDETTCPIKYKFGSGKCEIKQIPNQHISNQQISNLTPLTALCGDDSSLKASIRSLKNSQSSGKLSNASSVSCLSVASSISSSIINTKDFTRQIEDENVEKNGEKNSMEIVKNKNNLASYQNKQNENNDEVV
uniref:Uncharacterized protein n=1 Tax=Meloidogyne hapla TaxID=6305 RepID=A0A1I8B6F6_MELHA